MSTPQPGQTWKASRGGETHVGIVTAASDDKRIQLEDSGGILRGLTYTAHEWTRLDPHDPEPVPVTPADAELAAMLAAAGYPYPGTPGGALTLLLDELAATKAERYPYVDNLGPTVVIGPECFADVNEEVISWKGENYVRQTSVLAQDQQLAKAWDAGYLVGDTECRTKVREAKNPYVTAEPEAGGG